MNILILYGKIEAHLLKLLPNGPESETGIQKSLWQILPWQKQKEVDPSKFSLSR